MTCNDPNIPAVIVPPYPAAGLEDITILIGSKSPRRRELLGMILPDFKIAEMHDIDETYPDTLPAEEVPAYLSQLKAQSYASLLQEKELIITADTVVIIDGKILGKPEDEKDAERMLYTLSGRTHRVVTGVTLTAKGFSDTFSEHTDVNFDKLSDSEIEKYVQLYRPMDKAGAYGIQEWIGAVGISGINGCYYNVMGLPLHALYRHLCKAGEYFSSLT